MITSINERPLAKDAEEAQLLDRASPEARMAPDSFPMLGIHWTADAGSQQQKLTQEKTNAPKTKQTIEQFTWFGLLPTSTGMGERFH